MASGVESEIKLEVATPEEARAALARIGAERVRPRHFEDNLIFDDAASSLLGSGQTLRLRRTDAGGVLTHKGPRRDREGVKTRPERETAVADADALQAILEAMGLVPMFRYQKYREVYHWDARGDRGGRDAHRRLPGDRRPDRGDPSGGRPPGLRVLGLHPRLLRRPLLRAGGHGEHGVSLKAMVLAAGLGMRMRPLTLLAAKPALPVLNRPLLHWTLETLARAGVRQVVVNTHHLPGSVRRAAGDGRAFGLEVTYAHERRILGTGGGPRAVRGFFGDEPFLLVNGDVLFDFDLAAVVARHRASGARATLVLKDIPDVEAYGGVVTRRDGSIVSIAGLPRPAAGREALFTGVHVLDPALLDRLPPGPSDSVRHLYAPLLAEGALCSACASGPHGTISAVRRCTSPPRSPCCRGASAAPRERPSCIPRRASTRGRGSAAPWWAGALSSARERRWTKACSGTASASAREHAWRRPSWRRAPGWREPKASKAG